MKPSTLVLLHLVLLPALGCRDVSLPPPPSADESGCTADSECAQGICLAGQCSVYACRGDSSCEADKYCYFGQPDGGTVGPSSTGVCTLGCREGAGCGEGKRCNRTPYGTNACDQCGADADCSAHMFCADVVGGGFKICSNAGVGPAILGDATALTLKDNLGHVVAWARARWPSARLVSLFAFGLTAAGTVDITSGYASQWHFKFQVGDGVSKYPDSYVVYLSGQQVRGNAIVSAGEEAFAAGIPDQDIERLADSSALVSAFQARQGCAALSGDATDNLVVTWDASKRYTAFLLANWKSQLATGNAVTGEFDSVTCD